MKKLFPQILCLALLSLSSCLKKPEATPTTTTTTTTSTGMEAMTVPAGFNFVNSQDVSIKVTINDNQDKAMANVPFSIYTSPGSKLLITGMTSSTGTFDFKKSLGNDITSLTFKTDFPGIPNELTTKITAKAAVFTVGGSTPAGGRLASNANEMTNPYMSNAIASELSVAGLPPIKTLGDWNSAGVPKYLEPKNDAISTDFYRDITASLPESQSLAKSHPEYLKSDKPAVLNIKEKSDVWVTFVHEGAGWLNSMGFYTFDPKNPPQSPDEIKSITMIFPNVSFSGSGGGLVTGNKVKIGTFEAGVGIGFVLLADAFKDGKVTNGNYAHYSHTALNVEKDVSLRRHIVILDDSKSDRFLLAFEDVSRENTPINCDNDFNDAVFFITSNPVTAIADPNFPKMDTFQDSDGDGVGDTLDEYPKDPTRAFNAYTPSKTEFSTLAYEDLWPGKGDYDFNDLVLDYQFQEVLNAKNQVVEIKMKSVVRAIGASYKNGWGFQMPIDPSSVKTVTGTSLKNKYVSTSGNGTESGQSKAVIIAFDNAFDQVHRAGSGFINTESGQAYSQGDTLNLYILLSSPISSSQLGTPPYNPFLIIDGDRTKEVHLPNYAPTDKVSTSLFGTLHDRSDAKQGIYYKTEKNLPWAIQFPTSFDYPIEKTEVLDAYNHFREWAESGGAKYPDWFTNQKGYRNDKLIYQK